MATSDHAHVVSGEVHNDAHVAPCCGETFKHAHPIPASLKLAQRSAVRTPYWCYAQAVHSHGIQIQAEDFKPSALTQNGTTASVPTSAFISSWPNGGG